METAGGNCKLKLSVETVGGNSQSKLLVETVVAICQSKQPAYIDGGNCRRNLPVHKLTVQIAKNVFLTPLINYQHCAWTGAKVKCGLWTTIVNPRIYDGIFFIPENSH